MIRNTLAPLLSKPVQSFQAFTGDFFKRVASLGNQRSYVSFTKPRATIHMRNDRQGQGYHRGQFYLSVRQSGTYSPDTKMDTDPKDPRLSYKVNVADFQNTAEDDVPDIVAEVTEGRGYLCIPEVFSQEDTAHARELIYYLIKTEGRRATHFQGSNDATPELQARTWNLLNKGEIFEKMVQHPKILAILERILGDDLQLGSIAANTLFPGASGQEPHIDYPYWDYYERKHWPATPKVECIPFHMNMQVTILLDDFTVENGASGVIPFSQMKCEYPNDAAAFYENCVQTTGKAGDVVIFPGLIQHCAMPNKSNSSRSGLIIQYLPKYIRPMEDIKRALTPEVLKRVSMIPRLRKLLLVDYPYPAILDEAEAVNTEGSKSDFNWK